jgi:DNA-binding MarR family transcriptional regulator
MRRDRRVHPYLSGTLDAIRRIIRVLRLSSRSAEREFGIGSAQLFVLQQLATAPARSVNELAERTYTHQSSVSIVVRRLVEQGLVARRRATDDRRRRELKLTEAGRRLVARAPVPSQVHLINALRTLPLSQLRTLERLLGRVVYTMGASDEPPAMLFTETVTPEWRESQAKGGATASKPRRDRSRLGLHITGTE